MSLFQKYFAVLLLIISITFNGTLYAQKSVLKGNDILQIGSLTTTDTEYLKVPITNYNTFGVENLVRLKLIDLDFDDSNISFSVNVPYTLELRDAGSTIAVHNDSLEVTWDAYGNADFSAVDEDVNRYTGGYEAILNVDFSGMNTASMQFLKHVELTLELNVDRVYEMDLNQEVTAWHTYNNDVNDPLSDDEVTIYWNGFPGAIEYEVNFFYLDLEHKAEWDYLLSNGGFDSNTNSTTYMFDLFKTRTRIVTNNLKFAFTAATEKSILIYFVRPIGLSLNDKNRKVWGAFNYSPPNQFIQIDNDYQDNRNWSYSAVYSSESKKGESIAYVDATGRARQSVAKDWAHGKAIVAEQFYGFLGEPNISTAPGVVPTKKLSFYENFTVNSTGATYNKENFATDKKLKNPDTINPKINYPNQNEYHNNYFSKNNPFRHDGVHGYIPDAEGYNFTQTLFNADGKVMSTSGVGPDHKMGSGHEIDVMYAAPSQVELDRLFGNEVGLNTHYSYAVTRNQDGQKAISYYNLAGQVIATALVGTPGKNLEGVVTNNYEQSTNFDIDLINEATYNVYNSIDGVKESNYDLFIKNSDSQSPGEITMNYSMTADEYDQACGNPLGCYYDVTIQVFNREGYPLLVDGETEVVFTIEPSDFSGNTEFSKSMVVQLEDTINPENNETDYSIIRKVKLNESKMQEAKEELEKQLRNFANQDSNSICITEDIGVQTLEDIKTGLLEEIRPPCEDDCNEFAFEFAYYYTSIHGSVNQPELDNALLDPLSVMPTSKGGTNTLSNVNLLKDGELGYLDGVIPTVKTLDPFVDVYFQAKESICDGLSLFKVSDNSCDAVKNVLLNDMKPGGQVFEAIKYGRYGFLKKPSDFEPFYAYGNNGEIDTDISYTGFIDWNDLASNWKNGFAETLLSYHPEYCNLTWCEATAEFYEKEQDILSMTYEDALATGFFEFDNLSTYTLKSNSSLDVFSDPMNMYGSILGGQNGIVFGSFNWTIQELFDEVILALNDGVLLSVPLTLQNQRDIWRGIASLHQKRRFDVLNYNKAEFLGRSSLSQSCHYPFDVIEFKASNLPNGINQVIDNPIGSLGLVDPNSKLDIRFPWYDVNPNSNFLNEIKEKLINEELFVQDSGSYGTPCEGGFVSYLSPDRNPIGQDYCFLSGSNFESFEFQLFENGVNIFSIDTSVTPGNCNEISDQLEGFLNSIEGISVIRVFDDSEIPQLNIKVDRSFTTGINEIQFTIISKVAGESTYITDNFYLNYSNDFCETNNSPSYCGCEILAEIGDAYAAYNPTNDRDSLIDLGIDVDNGELAFKKSYFEAKYKKNEFVYYEQSTGVTSGPAQITMDQYATWQELCNLHKDPAEDYALPLELSCGDEKITCLKQYYADINRVAYEILESQITAELKKFEEEYRENCFGNGFHDKLITNYQLLESAYTLYYYDVVGNLYATIYPEGVRVLDTNQLAEVRLARQGDVNATPYLLNLNDHRHHVMSQVNLFKYNALGEVKATISPDAGGSKFFYDNLGRLIASQNALQREVSPENTIRYSITKFDNLGRIDEVGELEITANKKLTNLIARGDDTVSFNTWMAHGRLKDVTKTFYDEMNFVNSSVDNEFINNGTGAQEYNRNRIVAVAHYEDGYDHEQDYTSAYYYRYNLHGLTTSHIQCLPELYTANQSLAVKLTNYEFDLFSGTVEKVTYQPNKEDQLITKFEYDPSGRLKSTYSSTDGVLWDRDAKNQYMFHGPKHRMEVGDRKIQGIDIVTGLAGLKGVNSNTLQRGRDAGKDGVFGTAHADFAEDVAGFALKYYQNDYNPIANDMEHRSFEANDDFLSTTSEYLELYSGQITASSTALHQQDANKNLYKHVNLNTYKYDNAYNFIEQVVFQNANVIQTNSWDGSAFGGSPTKEESSYYVKVEYDLNKNIKSLRRNKKYDPTTGNADMDKFTYEYDTNAYGLESNQLKEVLDNVVNSGVNEEGDYNPNAALIGQIGTGQNGFEYNAIGALKENRLEGINIEWTTTGKVKSITRTSNLVSGDNIQFRYDAFGRRIVKIVKPRKGVPGPNNTFTAPYTEQPEEDWVHTYYALDGNGVTQATYKHQFNLFGRKANGVHAKSIIKVNPLPTQTTNNSYPELELSVDGNIIFSEALFGPHLAGQENYTKFIADNIGNSFVGTHRPDICESCIEVKQTTGSSSVNNMSIVAVHNFSGQSPIEEESHFTDGTDGTPIWTALKQELQEHILYADGRLGVWTQKKDLTGATPSLLGNFKSRLGDKNFEFKNWLGSVISVFKDIKYKVKGKEGDLVNFENNNGVLDPDSWNIDGANVSFTNPNAADIELIISTNNPGEGVEYAFNTIPGEEYTVTFDMPALVHPNYKLHAEVKSHSGANTILSYRTIFNHGKHSISFKADASKSYIKFVRDNPSSDGVIEIRLDDIQDFRGGYYKAVIANSSDYYPYGMAMAGRSWSASDYRYGYQGSEVNRETYGNSNQYTTEFRQLDPRFGRWFSMDPVFQPHQSPYNSMDGNPVNLTDVLGDQTGNMIWESRVSKAEKKYDKKKSEILQNYSSQEYDIIIKENSTATQSEAEDTYGLNNSIIVKDKSTGEIVRSYQICALDVYDNTPFQVETYQMDGIYVTKFDIPAGGTYEYDYTKPKPTFGDYVIKSAIGVYKAHKTLNQITADVIKDMAYSTAEGASWVTSQAGNIYFYAANDIVSDLGFSRPYGKDDFFQVWDRDQSWTAADNYNVVKKMEVQAAMAGGMFLPGGAVAGGLGKGIGRRTVTRGFQKHHIIPNQIYKKFKSQFDDIGWYQDHALNLKKLPTPFHGNHPAYNKYVMKRVEGMMDGGTFDLESMKDFQYIMRKEINDVYQDQSIYRLNDFYKENWYEGFFTF